MVLPSFVKLILCGTLAGAVGGLLGGLPTVARGGLLGLMLTLLAPPLNWLSRRAEDESGEAPLLLLPNLGCGLAAGLAAVLLGRWLDTRLPYPANAAQIPGWFSDLAVLLTPALMLAGYRLRLRSPRWHRAMPFLVWLGAALPDGLRFLPLVRHDPGFAAPAFLGAFAGVAVFVFGWLLSLRLHDAEYDVHDLDEDEPSLRRSLARLAVRLLAVAAVLFCTAYLFARQVGFAHSWHMAVVWNHPELAERVSGQLYSAHPTPGNRHQLDLKRTAPETTWPGLLEVNSHGDALLLGDSIVVAEKTAVRGWNLETGVMTIEFPMEWASLALSPDGRFLACVGNHSGDAPNDLRLAILKTEDGTMIHDLTVGFQRQGLCWTADGQKIVGVVEMDKIPTLFAFTLKGETSAILWPGKRPRLEPATGAILYLHDDALWRRFPDREEPERLVGGLDGVTDYRLAPDGGLLLVARERLHRFGAMRHYLLAIDPASPAQRHALDSRHIPSWCLWQP